MLNLLLLQILHKETYNTYNASRDEKISDQIRIQIPRFLNSEYEPIKMTVKVACRRAFLLVLFYDLVIDLSVYK